MRKVNNARLNNLGMAKKRNHKIEITNEAIKKVPFIHYREIPKEEYQIIYQLIKKVLQLSKDENNSNEVAITYSFDESKLAAGEEVVGVQFGDEHSVDLMADTLTYHLIMTSKECAVVSMHNHPSLSLISVTDIQFFLQYRSVCLLCVVTNLGSISYMVKSSRYDYVKAIHLLNETILRHNAALTLKEYQDAARYFLKNCYKVGIIYENI